jgi:hypothetical protein
VVRQCRELERAAHPAVVGVGLYARVRICWKQSWQ